MENVCYCCSACIESEDHRCRKNTLRINDIENVNYFDENIYEIYAQFCCHNQRRSNEKIKEIFQGWNVDTMYAGRFKISNVAYMLQKGCYVMSSYTHIEGFVRDSIYGCHWGCMSFKQLINYIKIGSIITFECDVASVPHFFKLISNRSWELKKIGISNKHYVVVQEELVTKVALK